MGELAVYDFEDFAIIYGFFIGIVIGTDNVQWEQKDYDELTAVYPQSMTLYENKAKEIALYNVDWYQIHEGLGDFLLGERFIT